MTLDITAFRRTSEQKGLVLPENILPGRIVRFPGVGKTNGNKSGWAWLSEDGEAAAFGDWATGLSETWQAAGSSTMTPTEQAAHTRRTAELRRVRSEEERLRHEEAAKHAQTIWAEASPAPDDHPYLTKKHVHSHGLRVDEETRLIVPVTISGTITSTQSIDGSGAKLFQPGGAVKGGSHVIGDLSSAATILICEGFATSASLHEATGLPVACAFSAGNLTLVAEQLRQQFPAAIIIICGDHDVNGTGQREARRAVNAVSGLVVIPEIEGYDFNDVHVQLGLDTVRKAIDAGLPHHAPLGPQPISDANIIDEVHDFLGRFVAYPSEHAHIAHTLWIAHAHLMGSWESTPRIAFISPEPGSGKTRALELTETLVPRPVEAINVSTSYLFRKISKLSDTPTILFDEIDTIFGPRAKENEELRGFINAGHRRGASAGRCVVRGKTVETEDFPAYCALAMAGLGRLPDTILSRSVIVRMRRRAPSEQVTPYRRRIHAPEGNALRDRLADWTSRIENSLNVYPTIPEGIEDRNADVWEALLSIAEAAGGPWPERAKVAAVALVADSAGDRGSLGVRLLRDIKAVFKDQDRMWTDDLLTALIALEESPWGDLKGKAMDSTKLAHILRPYGAKSKQVKMGGVNRRGYEKESFSDAWARYIPKEEKETETSPPPSRANDPTPATGATGGWDVGQKPASFCCLLAEEEVLDDH